MVNRFVIFDIDGTLANVNHRFHHSRISCNCGLDFFPHGHTDDLDFSVYKYYEFFKLRGYKIYIFTSRNEKYRFQTEKWLNENNIIVDKLEMRLKDDYRPSYIIKEEFLKKNFQNISDFVIQAVFESDESCIEMYKQNEIKKIYNYQV